MLGLFLAKVVSFQHAVNLVLENPRCATFPIYTLTFGDFNTVKMLKIIGYDKKFNLGIDRYYDSKLFNITRFNPFRGTLPVVRVEFRNLCYVIFILSFDL